MNFRQQRPDDEPEINLTSLIDVVFLLLIFFMVTTTFSKDAAIKLQLPEAVSAKIAPSNDNRIVIQINEAGQYALKSNNDAAFRQLVNTDIKTLQRAIREVGANLENAFVVVRADKLASYEAVIKAMDAARVVGLTQITLSVEQSQ